MNSRGNRFAQCFARIALYYHYTFRVGLSLVGLSRDVKKGGDIKPRCEIRVLTPYLITNSNVEKCVKDKGSGVKAVYSRTSFL